MFSRIWKSLTASDHSKEAKYDVLSSSSDIDEAVSDPLPQRSRTSLPWQISTFILAVALISVLGLEYNRTGDDYESGFRTDFGMAQWRCMTSDKAQ